AHGDPAIGGRYSVLSAFGLVPAAVMGLDLRQFLARTQTMIRSCAAAAPPHENPGLALGILLGKAAREGRDKVTIIASPGLRDFGAWLEQLLAESTGKRGRGLIPVDGETLGAPAVYGRDRLFVQLRLGTARDPLQEERLEALEKAGHPVVRIDVTSPDHLGQEFFRWEIATAVAGVVLGINPFDQPDVEASKVKTRALTAAFEKTGSLPPETPFLVERGVKLFADPGNAALLAKSTLAGVLEAHFARVKAGDYVALLAYIERNTLHAKALNELRLLIRDRTHVASAVGFGPRFLHSTGQAYKGGPNSGVFLQITCDDPRDIDVPGQKYSFGIIKAAAARGDFEVLAERGRRALRVHLGGHVAEGLAVFGAALRQALE
ncbi:MAG TPA: transaldolase, partial [Stellaceae bacterium]|nr:transaldolase [Stellaceae bacterium]